MSPFRVGETLIAGRYRLLRFIAQGGMGEVYEAFDEELRQRVAMKVVRRDVAANPVAMERFKREISLARRVTHPNVSRIFDYGRHTDGDGAVTFLTMELLEGDTLEERIRIGGPLAPGEARPIVEQMCEGLAAAHEAGVVHRDLKSSNVILVPAGDGAVRVVLTDFGLARALTGDDAATATLTATDLMVGTPAYMSPEQAQGTEITARSDLYSLGVVLFEMVTGAFPHAGATPMAILMNRLKEPPPSPLAVMPTLDPAWDGVIRRCLEVRPERRFESARDVARALHGQPVAPPPPLTPAEFERETASVFSAGTLLRRARRRWIAAGVAAALLVAAALALVFLPRGTSSRNGGRRSAAVLGFKNLSGRPDAAWLSTALSEMLTAELGAGEQLRTIPGETVARAKAELAIPDTDALAPATLSRVGSLMGSDLVVLGSFFTASTDASAPLRVDLRVQDASGGGRDAVISETGTAGEILTVVASLGRKLRARLEVPEASPAQVESAHASFPESPEAQRLYAEGLSRLRSFDLVEARRLLEGAAGASPKNALINSALAACYTALGDDGRARSAAQAAFDLSGSLSREERLLMEAQLAEAKREWPKAIEDYRALWRFFPDDVEHALRLAGALTASGRAKDALTVLSEADRISRDPRLSLAQSEAHLALSRVRAALESARRTISAGNSSGARLLVAQARIVEGDALLRLGDHAGAAKALEAARSIFATTGDRNAEARAINRIAGVAYEEGDYAGARRGFEQAGEKWEAAGNRLGALLAQSHVADVYSMTGELSKAAPLYEKVAESLRQIGNPSRAILTQENLAMMAYLRGAPNRALQQAEEAEVQARSLGLAYERCAALVFASLFRAGIGDAAGAQRVGTEAVAMSGAIESPWISGWAFHALGEARRAAGDLASAREAFQQALQARQKVAAHAEQIDDLSALGDLERRAGRPGEGLRQLREAVRLAAGRHLPDAEMVAQGRLARCALAAGNVAEAEKAAERGEALAKSSENVPGRLEAFLAVAEVVRQRGDAARADALFVKIRSEAAAAGFALLQRDAAEAAARPGKG